MHLVFIVKVKESSATFRLQAPAASQTMTFPRSIKICHVFARHVTNLTTRANRGGSTNHDFSNCPTTDCCLNAVDNRSHFCRDFSRSAYNMNVARRVNSHSNMSRP